MPRDSFSGRGSSLAWLMSFSLAACGSADRSGGPAQPATAGATMPVTAGQPGQPAGHGPQGGSPAADSGAPFAQAGAGGEQTSGAAGNTGGGPSAGGRGGSAGAPQGGNAPEQPPAGGVGGTNGADACPARYTTASRFSIDMSWPATLGYVEGQGKAQFWVKSTHLPTANGSNFEETHCGMSVPPFTTTVLLEGRKISPEIPTATFDLPTMPRSAGRSEWKDGMLVTDSVNMLGITLDDPNAPWPVRRQLVPFDHDADGKPGVTAILKDGGGFGLPPTSVAFTDYADALYVASRVSLRVTGAAVGCMERVEGTVELLGYDYSVVGCHAKDRGECDSGEANLYSGFTPEFTFGAGSWTSIPISESATCTEVQAALPAE